ncbi:HAMP domain-containing sensor histidine kinase [Nocardioides sp. GY 10127]|uniref:sensor histidine kinase n=1 Tax=Nocardioides sp. GY 10127 TaxID=2569762 RepID=UPI0010A936AD|nr:HAMP domain-containing sensor histidine kinase [Nocardioides sp. GY 10127]TIC79289.1 HAMP domain-containing histidine kinase [Nocardioides sp. GY 10127]
MSPPRPPRWWGLSGRSGSWPSIEAAGRRRLGLRGQVVTLAAVVALLVAVVLAVVLQAVLNTSSSSAADRVLDDRADAVVSSVLATTTASSGITVPDTLLDPGVVVYDDTGALVAGSVPASLGRVFDDLSTSTSRRIVRAGDAYRLLALPFETEAGGAVVVIAEPLAPYEGDEVLALVVTIVAGVVLVALSAAVAGWASGRALAPVAAMAATAEEWSEHDLQRRFELGAPTNEIRALGHTLDALLDRVAQAIRAEQRLTAELAHELRTPLTSLQVTAELAASRDDLDADLREDLDDILAASRSMAATITVLLDVARAQASPFSTAGAAGGTPGGGAAPGTPAADAVRQAVDQYVLSAAVALDVPDDLVLEVPRELAVRALAPVLANADRHGTHVRVTARLEGDRAWLDVTDDGDGVHEDDAEALFLPGRSGSGGAGLGLPLARRVARSAGGDVTHVPGVAPGEDGGPGTAAGAGGATFRVSLPAHARVG